MPYEEYLDTRFYREWAQPQGWVDSANAVLDKSATSFALFSVYRHAASGLVDDLMRRRMQLVVPHVRRAVMIGKAIDLKSVKTAAFVDALDGLSVALFLVDAFGRIAHANISGHDMLADGRILRNSQDVLAAADPQAARTLLGAIAAASDGDAAVGAGGVAVVLSTSPELRWLAHI